MFKSFNKHAAYYFISPFYFLFSIFFLVPTLLSFLVSFYRWRPQTDSRWLGFKNYERILSDELFWKAVFNTSIYIICCVFVINILALLLAVMLNSKQLYFRKVWRTIFFSPIVTSSVAISLTFLLLFDSNYGAVNEMIQAIGLKPVPWLNDGFYARIVVCILLCWRFLGLQCIYYLAGLQTINLSLYDAAIIDGASKIQRFWHITLPGLKPIIIYCVFISFIGSIQVFDEPQMLTQGGPSYQTLSVAQYMYFKGFESRQYGLAAAVGIVLFIVVACFSFALFKFSSKKER